jgi:hypothetical protein
MKSIAFHTSIHAPLGNGEKEENEHSKDLGESAV